MAQARALHRGRARGLGRGLTAARVKVLEVTNVDFALRQFILPLMRGIRQRGHEVVGVCADGPLV